MDVPRETDLPAGRVTLLFSDIEGSTHLVEALGERYGDVLARHFEVVEHAIGDAGGIIVVAHSDAVFAVFSGAREAVGAAVAAQRGLDRQEWPAGVMVRVRMGLHTGTPRPVEDRKIGYVGLDVHRAARICAAAHGGQVVLSATASEEVADVLPPGVRVRHLGTHRLKDLRFPESLADLVIDGHADRFEPIRSLDNRPNNLPALLSPLIGRARELVRVRTLLDRPESRLVSVTGPGGVGKTRLAIEAARESLERFPDGVFLVAVSAVGEAGLVLPAIAQTLALPEMPGRGLADSLRAAFRGRRILLVIDGFEHVMDAAGQILDLLEGCPTLAILLTSQEALDVGAEHELRLAPMPVPPARPGALADLSANDSIHLFLDRVRDFRPDFELTADNAAAIAAICRRLEGLPLAIELAAPRLRLLEPAELERRLAGRLGALAGSGRPREARHRSLHATIDWSYSLLDADERAMFERLSVFRGGVDLAFAEAVAAGAVDVGEVERLLDSLVRKSLLRREVVEGEPRLYMLDAVREFGEAALDGAGAGDRARSTHRGLFLALVRTAAPDLLGARQREATSRLLVERDNVRAALDRAIAEEATGDVVGFLRGLLWLWIARGQFTEGRTWTTRALAIVPSRVPLADRAEMVDVDAWLSMISGDYAGARPLFEACHAHYEAHGPADRAAMSLMAVGITRLAAAGEEEGLVQIEEALRRFRGAGDRYGTGICLIALGEAARLGGAPEPARQAYEEALEHMRAVDDMYWIAALLLNISHIHLAGGRWRGASRTLTEALAIGQRYDYPMVVTVFLSASARLALALDRPEEAARLGAAVETSLERIGARFEPTDRAAFDEVAAAVAERLPAPRLSACRSDGAGWSLAEAVSSAEALVAAARGDVPARRDGVGPAAARSAAIRE